METYICCICQKNCEGMGNSPRGAVDETKKIITWEEADRCCDECNKKYVLPGRMYRFYHVIKNEALVRKGTN